MNSIFSTILTMSLSASAVALAIVLVRLFLKRAPKVFSYALWGLVLFRMICPVSFSSDISVVPNFNEVTAPIAQLATSELTPVVSEVQNPQIDDYAGTDIASQTETEMDLSPVKLSGESAQNYNQPLGSEETSVSAKQPVPLISILGLVWVAGMVFMLGFATASYIWMHNKVMDATKIKDIIFESDKINSPFVFGLIRPKIYLPTYHLDDGTAYIIAHERTHIRRGDHIVRAVFWTALAVHWFNPLMWLCFFLMNRDMELSCDEHVINNAGEDIRAKYSKSMLAFAVRRSGLMPLPLAFGETSVQARVKNTLHYKKPAFWITAIVTVIVVAISLTLVGNATVFGGGVGEEKEIGQSEPEAIEWSNDDLSLYGKILQVDDWIYYVPDYNYTVYRIKEDGSDNEALFTAILGQQRGGGTKYLTRCGDYLLFTHAAYIYKMDLKTLKTEVLVKANDPSTCFDLAVNGDNVYFIGTNIEADYLDGIYVIDIEGKAPKKITEGVSGDFWKIQIYGDKVYVSAQNAGLVRTNLDGSNAEHIPDVLEHSAGDFIISNDRVFWLTYDNILLGAYLDGTDRIVISDYCTGFIIKDRKLVYSEIKSQSSGIFMCETDGKNQETIYEGIASVIGSCDSKILIDDDSGAFKLIGINVIGGKTVTNDNSAESETAKVTSKEEFIEAIADKNIKNIEISADITLDGSGYNLYSNDNKQLLIIDEHATLTVETLNLMLSGCDVVNNGKIIVSGRIMSYDEVEFTGSGEISCIDFGTIECYIQSNPSMSSLKRLLSKDSVYTNVSVRAWDETELLITEDMEIAQGKIFEVLKYDEDYTLVVADGVTLTNNGTLILSNYPKIEGKYKGNGTVYVQGKAVNL